MQNASDERIQLAGTADELADDDDIDVIKAVAVVVTVIGYNVQYFEGSHNPLSYMLVDIEAGAVTVTVLVVVTIDGETVIVLYTVC